MELSSAIFDISFIWMGCFMNLSCFNGVDREEVARDIVFNADVGCVLHLLEVLIAACFDEVEIFSRVLCLGILWLEM